MEAVAVLSSNAVYGYVLFRQEDEYVSIEVDLFKMNKSSGKPLIGLHGFHIHASGDLRRGCDSCCKHYNPEGVDHGGLENGHAGDLGNLEFDEKGNCKQTLRCFKFKVIDIVGRSVIVHEKEDDLGLGTGENAEESRKTGNSKKRIACGVIGYAESTCEK